jgi:putative peptidoglycan lipid II flippase
LSSSSTQIENSAEKPQEPTVEAQKPPPSERSSWRIIGLVSAATLLSRILGLVREIVFGALFPRIATDAFSIAQMIPNLLRRLLAEGILSTAFIPVFAGYHQKTKAERGRAYGAVLALFVCVLIAVTVIGILLAPWIVKLFAPGFGDAKLALTIDLTRIAFPFVFLVGLTAFWTALLHTDRHFTTPALGPVLLNLGIIGCALGLRHLFPESHAVASMAVGILVGGLLQLALQIAMLYRRRVHFRLHWEPSHPAIAQVLHLMAPTLLGLGIYQLNLLISKAFASFLPTGSVTYIYYSDRLMELPLGVIAVAFATVNLPMLSSQAENKQWQDFDHTLTSGLKAVIFFCIPASFGMFVLREPIIATLFQRGMFTVQDAIQCAHVFAPATFALIFAGALRNLTPAFYAIKDTRTPVKVALWSLLINITLSALLAFGLNLQAMGLTLANAISTSCSVALTIYYLHHKLPYKPNFQLQSTVLPILCASAAIAFILWPIAGMIKWYQLSTLMRLFWLCNLIAIGSAAFLLCAWLLRIPHAQRIVAKILRRRR